MDWRISPRVVLALWLVAVAACGDDGAPADARISTDASGVGPTTKPSLDAALLDAHTGMKPNNGMARVKFSVQAVRR